MTLSRESILLDGIKAALTLYERSLVWATTAALSGLVLAFRLRNPEPGNVSVMAVGEISTSLAWAVAQVLYLIFGILALSAIQQYQRALIALAPSKDIFEAIIAYPSLATLPNRFFRIGAILLPPVATLASWTVELWREHSSPTANPTDSWFWLGSVILAGLILSPYIGIMSIIRATCAPEKVRVRDASPQVGSATKT